MEKMVEAVLVPEHGGMWDLRTAVCRALIRGARPQRCMITREDAYFPGELDRMLRRPGELERHLQKSVRWGMGRRDGAQRCMLLTDMETQEGMLAHYCGRWEFSYWPLLDTWQAYKERSARLRLFQMAEEFGGTPVELARPLAAGRYDWADLLLRIAGVGEADRAENAQKISPVYGAQEIKAWREIRLD